ncbi:MAG TPA: class I SAM-dependent methyltransferase [Hypericibacter adhaerens]|jgi:SAM-dependent methyltransferase|uniref:class I SAM-dependent methyltransferase n=1 Tax=Hypericibacter adhaerens TaxID=2602016 RepID=UPI002B6DA7F3|nr:class I SAM-dependent methyltransferase [Hypericibacter adhaerens]HWA43841.1 class I SAM-dependent methyltransferase [Hypericibacter adhaerens]
MIATAAKGFANRAAEYETGRPEYPEALLGDLPLAGARAVLDLGAGTGKFTRVLAAHVAARTGGTAPRLYAVEPVREMAARLAALDLPVGLLDGTAEAIPLADGAVDLVCCAQSFHWFDYEPAAAEIHRVLAPGGHLALIWNLRDERVPWVAALTQLFDHHAGGTRRYATGAWRQVLEDPRFRLVRQSRHEFHHRMPRSGVYDRVLSTSFIAAMAPAEQAAVRAQVDRLMADHPEILASGRVEFPYVCELHLLQRVG